jgi:predicted DNA-binding transcriptional regulator YafY
VLDLWWRDSSQALTALPKLIEALWRGSQVRFDSEDEAVQLALAHGADIELIEPVHLRQAVVVAAARTFEKYAAAQEPVASR